MREHTPGPWEWWTSNSWRRLRHSDRGVSTNVLYPDVHYDGQADIVVSEADMHLIAAAPDLLTALIGLVEPEQFDRHPNDYMPVWHKARAAIAKAIGQGSGA